MTLFLDPGPEPPAGGETVATAAAAIARLAAGGVTRLSLAHDLARPEDGTGFDVACWLEQAAWKWSQMDAGGVGPLAATCHAPVPAHRCRIEWSLSRAATWWRIGTRRRAGTLPAQKVRPKRDGGYVPTGNEWREWVD